MGLDRRIPRGNNEDILSATGIGAATKTFLVPDNAIMYTAWSDVDAYLHHDQAVDPTSRIPLPAGGSIEEMRCQKIQGGTLTISAVTGNLNEAGMSFETHE